MPDDLKPGDIARTPSGCIVRIEAIHPPSESNWPYHECQIASVRYIDGSAYNYPNGASGYYRLDELRRLPKPSVVKLTYFDLRQVVARVNREPVRVDPSKLGWSRWCAIGRTVSYHEKWAEAVAAALAMCDARIEPSGGVLL